MSKPNLEVEIKEIARRHQATMCSVEPSCIRETIEEAIKEALKNYNVIGRFLPEQEETCGYQRCANCGKWNTKEEVEKAKAKTLL